MTYKPTARVLKFLLSGGLAFTIEYIAFIVLIYAFVAWLAIANIISFCLGLITSFLLNKYWVFNNDQKSKKQPILYGTLAICNLIISTFVISTLGTIIEPAIIKVVMVIAIAIWNYFIYKYFIFSYK
jgi:putative flippase GtrA